jgi:hypothetical protein
MTRFNRSSFAKKITDSRKSDSRNSDSRNSMTWGKMLEKNTGALLFAALLIVCSLAAGCNSDKPKPVSSNTQISVTQSPTPDAMLSSNLSTPAATPAKPAPKKIVKKRPATVTYTDQTYGVSFDYPRRYGLETGNAANELVASSPLPMNFIAPGGLALAAVELPESAFADTDLSAAYFNVSINKALTAEQCSEFAVPQPKVVASSEAQTSTQQASTQPVSTSAASTEAKPTPASTPAAANASAPTTEASTAPASAPASSTAAISASATSSASKLMLGDLELQSAEAVAGEGNRQSDTKYFHVFQNGGCYEFALNVTTVAHETEGGMKHVDRDKVFNRLAAIMGTVKINPVAAPEVTASAPAAPAASPTSETPAQ